MQIFIPTPLRPYAEGKDAVEVNVATIAEALDALTQTYPALRKHLFTEEGKLRAFVNLYCNDEDVRSAGEGADRGLCQRYAVDHSLDCRRRGLRAVDRFGEKMS